jgi:hypothetical protein
MGKPCGMKSAHKKIQKKSYSDVYNIFLFQRRLRSLFIVNKTKRWKQNLILKETIEKM